MHKITQIIKKTPLLGKMTSFINRSLHGIPKFTTSVAYWEARYRSGGNSGDGSYNVLAEYKAEVINQFVKDNQVQSVIEFGSGDGNQVRYFDFKSYTGFDVSQTAVEKCRKLFEADSTKRFYVVTAFNNEKADLVLSLDVIYHLVEDVIFHEYMTKLFVASGNFVLIYSSNEDNHENNNLYAHVKHRKFTLWVELNAPDFKLIHHIPNKYPFNGKNEVSSYADFYIFQRNQ